MGGFHKGEVQPPFGDDSDSLFFCRDESPLFVRVGNPEFDAVPCCEGC